MIKAILFDWSGTLVDDLPPVWQTTNHLFRRAGIPEITLERFRAEMVLPYKDFFVRYLPEADFGELEKVFFEHMAGLQHAVDPLPHAAEFLRECGRRGIKRLLISAIHPGHYAVQGRATGLHELLDHTYIGVRDKREKVHDILREHGLEKEHVLFIGDMRHDIDAAKAGGVASCGVLTGYNSLEQLREGEPDWIVEHLGELRAKLISTGWRLRGFEAPPLPEFPISTVGALIFNDRREALMIRTHKWSNRWGIPGGKIKHGETAFAALEREILEETNLQIEGIQLVMAQDCILPPEFYKPAHFILLNYTARAVPGREVMLNEEAQDWRWVPLAETLKMDLNEPTRRLVEHVLRDETQTLS